MAKCFPYVRFSTSKQADGSSIARQTERIDSFVSQHGLTVDTRLEDHGISGFRGANAKKGQLSGFLQRVRDGEIPQGSYLLIENWDRLSRQVLDASIEMFSELIRAGIKVAVLDEGTVYDDLTSLSFIRAIVQFERAHSESLRKSDMSKASWRHKHAAMEQGAIATEKCPQWLRVVDGQWCLQEDICQQIRAMFQLATTYGLAETGRRVNQQFGTSYKPYQIQYLLRNRRLIGEHSPVGFSKEEGKNVPTGQVIENYYPPVVDPTVFAEVQQILKDRRPFSGQYDATNLNIFRGLLVCAECGGSTRFMLKNKKEYYYCTASMTGGCVDGAIRSIRGEHLRRILFKYEHWSGIKNYLASGSDALKGLKSKEISLVSEQSRLEERISSLEAKHLAEQDPDVADTLIGLLTATRKKLKENTHTLGLVQSELAKLQNAFELTDENAEHFAKMLDENTEQAAADRQRLNRYLKKIFSRLELHFPSRKLTTHPIPSLAGRVTPLVASVSVPKDKRRGDDYGWQSWISAEQQAKLIRAIKARLRRAGIPSPSFEDVKPLYDEEVLALLPKKRKRLAKPSDVNPEDFAGIVWKSPDPFLKS